MTSQQLPVVTVVTLHCSLNAKQVSAVTRTGRTFVGGEGRWKKGEGGV